MTMPRQREGWVDAAKGLACLLVALGHGFQGLVWTDIMEGGPLWRWFDLAIYCFHVELFFLCSGYLWQRYGRSFGWREHARAVLGKAWLLGVPYVFFVTLSWCLKRLCEPWVNHKVDQLWRNLFVAPMAPYWYLATLLLLFAIMPRTRRKHTWILLFFLAGFMKFASCMLPTNAWPFAVRTLLQYAFWFAAGMGLASWDCKSVFGRPAAKWLVFACATLFLTGTIAPIVRGTTISGWFRWGLGVLACTSTLGWMVRKDAAGNSPLWNWLGRNALPIFLMHTIFAAAVRMGLLAIGIRSLWAHIPAMFAASIVGPMLAMRVLGLLRLDGLVDPRRWRPHTP